jgi:hypothetical protein
MENVVLKLLPVTPTINNSARRGMFRVPETRDYSGREISFEWIVGSLSLITQDRRANGRPASAPAGRRRVPRSTRQPRRPCDASTAGSAIIRESAP